jgi:hypothetical protein
MLRNQSPPIVGFWIVIFLLLLFFGGYWYTNKQSNATVIITEMPETVPKTVPPSSELIINNKDILKCDSNYYVYNDNSNCKSYSSVFAKIPPSDWRNDIGCDSINQISDCIKEPLLHNADILKCDDNYYRYRAGKTCKSYSSIYPTEPPSEWRNDIDCDRINRLSDCTPYPIYDRDMLKCDSHHYEYNSDKNCKTYSGWLNEEPPSNLRTDINCDDINRLSDC